MWKVEEEREAAAVEAQRLHELGGLFAKEWEPAEVALEGQAFDVYVDEEAVLAEDDFSVEEGGGASSGEGKSMCR